MRGLSNHFHYLQQTTELDEVEHIVPGKPGAGGHVLSDGKICLRNSEAGGLPPVFPPGQQLHDVRVLFPNSVGVLKLQMLN